MTTIVAYKNQLACDGRMTASNIIETDNYNKIRKLNDIEYHGDVLLYIGIAGTLACLEHVMNLLHEVELEKYKDEDEIESDISGIILGKKYNYLMEHASVNLVRMDKNIPLTIGSGANFAQSFLSTKLDIRKAIQHAMKFDSCTGGKIRVVTYKDK